MFTKDFWLRTAERAAKTFAQALIAAFGGVALTTDVKVWQAALIAAALATLLSVITSIASITIGDKGTPSLVPSEEQAVIEPDPLETPPEPLPNDLEDRQAISDYLAGGK